MNQNEQNAAIVRQRIEERMPQWWKTPGAALSALSALLARANEADAAETRLQAQQLSENKRLTEALLRAANALRLFGDDLSASDAIRAAQGKEAR